MAEKIRCLICDREFVFLPPHLRRAHGITADDYRREFDLPAGLPLAGDGYRDMQREKLRIMRERGEFTYDHLPQAVEASRSARERPKRGEAREKQVETVNKHQPWNKNRLPPGAKRADGRDADRAREYQREYRARKKRGG